MGNAIERFLFQKNGQKNGSFCPKSTENDRKGRFEHNKV